MKIQTNNSTQKSQLTSFVKRLNLKSFTLLDLESKKDVRLAEREVAKFIATDDLSPISIILVKHQAP